MWVHMSPCGSLWVHGSIWVHIGLCGSVWVHGSIWVPSGSVWVHGSIWVHAGPGGPCGFMLIHLGPGGSLWVHVGPGKSPWVCGIPYGPICVYGGPYGSLCIPEVPIPAAHCWSHPRRAAAPLPCWGGALVTAAMWGRAGAAGGLSVSPHEVRKPPNSFFFPPLFLMGSPPPPSPISSAGPAGVVVWCGWELRWPLCGGECIYQKGEQQHQQKSLFWGGPFSVLAALPSVGQSRK